MALLCVWAATAACSGDDDEGGACVSGSEFCGDMCDANRACPFGLYCSEDAVCVQDCDVDHPCRGGGRCALNGRCSGGSSVPGTDGGSMGSGGSRPGGPRPGACADTVVQTTRTTPTVMLIIDQSSSMEEDFDNGSRWNVLRDFLLGQPSGLIADLQAQVNFGLAMYSARSDDMGLPAAGEQCPIVTTVAPAPNNYAAIEQAYRAAEPIDDTPTGDSIDAVLGDLGISDPDDQATPMVFVLATDGEPDRCEELDPQNGQAEAIAAVTRAYSYGIRTFVISVGSELGEMHQQDIANAGLGRMPGDPDAEYWVAGNDQSLRAALTSIVGGQLGCEITLNGRVQSGDPCLGMVALNGRQLECGDANGWELVDPEHIRLLGGACDELKTNDDVFLDVSFPCDVMIVD
jgi:hypothetical protein